MRTQVRRCCVFLSLFFVQVLVCAYALAQDADPDCREERFEAIKGVSVQAVRCDGRLHVATEGVQHFKGKRGEPILLTIWKFDDPRLFKSFMYLSIAQLENSGTFDRESVWDTADTAKKDLLREHPDFKLEFDERTAWGGVNWLPAETIKIVKDREMLPDGTTRAMVAEVYTYRIIHDLRHNLVYILKTHGFIGTPNAAMWLETLLVKYE